MAEVTEAEIAQYLRCLVVADPPLACASARLVRHGQTSDVLIVNNRLVVRFPRHDDGAHRLAHEASLRPRRG